MDGAPAIEERLKPKFLIPPYFYLTADDVAFEEWLDLNLEFLNEAIELAQTTFYNCPVFGQLVINKEILCNKFLIDKIASRYSHSACNGITIWIDDFSEHTASKLELDGFICLLEKLKGNPVYNMYGGYLSILLTHKDICLLSAVSHGLEYGENRKVYPVGGGVPVSKYYFFPLHQRLGFTESYL